MTISFGGLSIGEPFGGATLDIGDPGPSPGDGKTSWSTDEEGRRVLHVPGGKKFSKLVVEFEEGARISRADGDSSGGRARFIG